MINSVVLMGRICKDLELKQLQSGTSSLSFNLAIERSYVDKDGERHTDFVPCVAYGKTAEFIQRFFSKGRMIAVAGELRSRNWEDKDGGNHFVLELLVNSASFTGERAETDENAPQRHEQKEEYRKPKSRKAASYMANVDALGDFEDILSDEGVPF